VPSLDRYGRTLHDLITMVGQLRHRDVGFAVCTSSSTPPVLRAG
jgi:DNA invertase Pin-like site-specific DNA recombinase